MRVGLQARRLWRRTSRTARGLAASRPPLTSPEAKLLASVWAFAALATLGVALAQGVRMFALSLLAVLFGTLAALWMLNGVARR